MSGRKNSKTQRSVIESEWLCYKHCKFPILVTIKICNLSKKATVNVTKKYSLSQKLCVEVRFHCRVQFFHADQWKLLLLDTQKWQGPGREHSELLNGEARLTSPSQTYTVLIKGKTIMISLTTAFRLLHYVALLVTLHYLNSLNIDTMATINVNGSYKPYYCILLYINYWNGNNP
jgi:hypothetical protein